MSGRNRDFGYWRSLDQLAGEASAREFSEREFPENAWQPPEGLTRREMLALLGASISLAGLTACRRPVEQIVPFVQAPEGFFPGVPERYATTMPFGLHAYGLLVESNDGRPTKIEGNELHPATRGGTSAWMQASILGLYDPDRSRSPRRGTERTTRDAFLAAWKERAPALRERRGRGLAWLTEAFASPTLARLAAELRTRFPEALWVAYEPASEEQLYRGVALATGRVLQPVFHLDRADVVLAVESDFLVGDPEAVRWARDFADRRRMRSPQDTPNRLYVVESTYSATGASADHRLPMRRGEMGVFLLALAAELAAQGASGVVPAPVPGMLPEETRRWIRALARDLLARRGRAVILVGPSLPPQVHAAALALNAALGAMGTALGWCELRDAALPERGALATLAEAMHAGSVDTLVILGGNPVYNAPADLAFAEALAKVEFSVHLSERFDETSQRTTWHLNRAHYLEAWGDARAVGGHLSVTQPLIEPLFGGTTDAELLALLLRDEPARGYELVRETWRGILEGGDFERRWQRVLHDGVLEDSALPEIVPEVRGDTTLALARELQAPSAGPELVFTPSYAVWDGRFANLAWLQELPDPVTKLTWDNAALVSPRTAARLGLETGRVVRLRAAGRELQIPVFVLPGQHDQTVTVALGYGRSAAGRVGNGVGVDAYALRTLEGFDRIEGIELEPTAQVRPLASTQDHWQIDPLGARERDRRVAQLYREATLAEYRRDPGFVRHHDALRIPLESIYPDHDYSRGYQWGMVIDLGACVGCNACVVACQSENNIPVVGKEQVRRGREMQWLRVDRYFAGEPEAPRRMLFQPIPCMHCENAPCEQVCPVAATVHDAEGLNGMVYNRCIGTRYCLNNCPYKVRRFNFFNFTKYTPELLRMANNPDVTVRSRGVMEKCTYCTQRIQEAKWRAKEEGRAIRDGELQTACQQACPTRAIEFGNLNDPESRVALLKQHERNYVLLEEMNNRPRTSYLARVRNPNPEIGDA